MNHYPWKRYWTPPDSQISLYDDGFLDNPMSGPLKGYINAHLKRTDQLLEEKCVVLLGEPGIGKSTEIKTLYEFTCDKVGVDRSLFIDLGDIPSDTAFSRELDHSKQYQEWMSTGKPLYLFLDSFDESFFSSEPFAKYIALSIEKNSPNIKNLFLRISCRTAVWPTDLEDRLKSLWGKDEVKKYELCPLTKDGVIIASQARKIDGENLLKDLKEKNVVGLACKPLTLNLLMDLYEKDGSLPNKIVDIYFKGICSLLQEQDGSKRSNSVKHKLNLYQRLEIAEKIAIATLLGGRPNIVLSQQYNPGTNEIHPIELLGIANVKGLQFNIGENDVREVLNTGLFSSRGDEKMGWAHKTYGEFLAASYLVDHMVGWEKIHKLLFHDLLNDGMYRIIPQHYEIGAWLVSLDSTFFDKAVVIDPEFLLLSDINALSNPQKKILVEQLLIGLAKGRILDRWEVFNGTNYKKLCHPNIANQLKKYIDNPLSGKVVRRSAIDIVSACSIQTLEDNLVKVALNNKESLFIRSRAVTAIAKIGSDIAKNKLKALIAEGFDGDPEDELKGATLHALWPKQLSTKSLFSLLTLPKRHNFMGSYFGFTERHLISAIPPKDIIIGLDWIEKNVIHERSIEFYLRKLADSIMVKAWENFTLPGIQEKFAAIVYERLKKFEDVIGGQFADDDTSKSFQQLVIDHDENRRKLIESILHLIMKEKGKDSERRGYIIFPHGRIKLILSKDLLWLTHWLNKEKDEKNQKILAEVIRQAFNTSSNQDVEIVYQARNKNKHLAQETQYWFEPINLNSEEATRLKKEWEQQQKWSKEGVKDEKKEILKIVSPSKISDLLEKAESGDSDSWWLLNNAMCLYRHELEEEDITKLSGWKIIDKETQERIINSGRDYLLKQESKPDVWLGKGKIYYPALAGYRALQIYLKKDKDFVEKLGKDVWERWAPITLGMPLISNDPENSKLITIAYKNAPQEIIKTLDILIDEEDKKFGSIHLIELLDGCVDERMSHFLLKKAQNSKFKNATIGDILTFLIQHNVDVAKKYARSLIKIPLSKEQNSREISLVAAVSLLRNIDQQGWVYLWSLIKKNNEFGKLLIEKAHEHPLRDSNLLKNLSEPQLADLYLWMMENFPPNKYSQPIGTHTVTPAISIADWRDSILRVLMDKGTVEGCREIKKIADKLPQEKWIKEFTVIETKRIALQKSWQAPSIKQIFITIKETENKPEIGKIIQKIKSSHNEFYIGQEWKLVKDGTHAYLHKNNVVKFTFTRTYTVKFRIFEYIWKKNRFVPYTEIDKKISNKQKMQKIGNEHKNLQRIMQELKTDFINKGLKEVTIDISGGFQIRLTTK